MAAAKKAASKQGAGKRAKVLRLPDGCRENLANRAQVKAWETARALKADAREREAAAEAVPPRFTRKAEALRAEARALRKEARSVRRAAGLTPREPRAGRKAVQS